MLDFLYFILVGGIAGWLASILVGKGSKGLLSNIIVGIIGALIGGWLFKEFGSGQAVAGFNLESIMVAFVGSVVLLFILRLLGR